MVGPKKVLAVALVIALSVVLAVYLTRPTASPTGTVVINEPEVPDVPDVGTDPGTEPDVQPGEEPAADPGEEPSDVPPRAHGLAAQNSNGPKKSVCLPENDRVPDHAADEGANRYRGMCLTFTGRGHR